jgi:hypothetical protein
MNQQNDAFADIPPLTAIITIADLTIETADNNAIVLTDSFDGRTERFICDSDLHQIEIITAFLQIEAPGAAFVKAFPFWA